MSHKNILIVGCGYVGCALAKMLIHSTEYSIWGLRRHVAKLPEGISAIQGDFCTADFLGEWPDTIDYVVFCAAPDNRTGHSYRQTYITGLQNVVTKLKAENYQPSRILFTSSTSVYHQKNGEWVDETSATCPTMFNGQIMLEAEQLLADSGFPSTTVRFGGIYGPGRDRLIRRVRAGDGCTAEPATYSNRIHREDCAGMLAFLIDQDRQKNPVDNLYLGVDGKPEPVYDVLQWLAKQLQVPINNNLQPSQRANRRCSNNKIKQAGYSFLYPDYQAGFTQLLTNEN